MSCVSFCCSLPATTLYQNWHELDPLWWKTFKYHLQGTITHPTKREVGKIIDSNVPLGDFGRGYVIVPRRVEISPSLVPLVPTFAPCLIHLKYAIQKKNINPIYQKDLSWQTLSLCIYSNLTLYNILYTIYLWSDSDSYKYLHMIIIYKTLKRLTKTTTRPQTLKGFPQSPSSSHETPRNGTSVRPKDSTSDSHSEEATELAGRDEVDRKPSRPWALWDVFFLLVGNQNAELGGKILCVCVCCFFLSVTRFCFFLGGEGEVRLVAWYYTRCFLMFKTSRAVKSAKTCPKNLNQKNWRLSLGFGEFV